MGVGTGVGVGVGVCCDGVGVGATAVLGVGVWAGRVIEFLSGVAVGAAEGVAVGVAVGARVVVGSGPSESRVFAGSAGVTAMIPDTGVSALSGIGAELEQAVKVIRSTKVAGRTGFSTSGLPPSLRSTMMDSSSRPTPSATVLSTSTRFRPLGEVCAGGVHAPDLFGLNPVALLLRSYLFFPRFDRIPWRNHSVGVFARAFSFSCQVGMDSYQGEGFRDVGGVAAQSSGDVGVSSPAHQGAGQVAKSGHHLGSVACPYLGAVFVKGHVPYPMHPTQCTRFSMSQCPLSICNRRSAPATSGARLVTA